ncbi:MAG: hypothetical protein RLN75_03605 [Longimicrobiales bacterium]
MRVAVLRRGGMALAAASAAVLGGCDNLGLRGEPEMLRVELEAMGQASLTLVRSTDFVFQDDPACEEAEGQQCAQVLRILDADTSTVSTPTTLNFPFTQTFQYFVEVYPETAATTVSMAVFIDGEPWSSESRELGVPPAGEERETIQFVYQYLEPRLR